jgi:hypothetical protein
MMTDDCKRERLGLKAQTRIPMRESGSGLPSKVQSPMSKVQRRQTLGFGLWTTLDSGRLRSSASNQIGIVAGRMMLSDD